jgi:EmrB/QacA subfamily drug resistance transporter
MQRKDRQPPVAAAPDGPWTLVSRRQLVAIVIGALLGMLLSSLDQTVVGTAMPGIAAELGGLEHYAWVFAGYMLASTVTLPIYGKLSDLYGRRPFFLGGMALFLLGSALAGMSQNMTQLILFRTLQGLGAGAILPIVQAIIGDIFPPAERGKWQGLVVAIFGLASIAGPTLGGWLTDHWGWRWVFYVNMPVGALALLTAGLALPRQFRRQPHRLDLLGAAALVAGTVPLLLAFSWGGDEYPWASAPIVGMLAWAVACLAAFVVIETRADEPIINPAFFRNSTFTVSVAASFLVSVGMFSVVIYLPLFVQGVLGDSATGSGLLLTPMLLAFIGSSILSGQILSRTGRYRAMALIGFCAAAAGLWLLSRMGPGTPRALLVGSLVTGGLGIGLVMSPLLVVVQNAFPASLLGQVTASLQFFRSIGGAIGISVLGSLLSSRFQGALLANLPPEVQRVSFGGGLATLQPEAALLPGTTAQLQQRFLALGPQGRALFQGLLNGVRTSLTSAIAGLFLVGFLVALLGLLTMLFLRETPPGARREPAPALAAAEEPTTEGQPAPALLPRGEPIHGPTCSSG